MSDKKFELETEKEFDEGFYKKIQAFQCFVGAILKEGKLREEFNGLVNKYNNTIEHIRKLQDEFSASVEQHNRFVHDHNTLINAKDLLVSQLQTEISQLRVTKN